MIEKYRVHEVAKDLGVQSKEVLDLLAANFEGERKSMTALDEKELSLVLHHYTSQNQVENFDEYFAAGEAKKQAAKQQAKEARAAAQQPKPQQAKEQQPAQPQQASQPRAQQRQDNRQAGQQNRGNQQRQGQQQGGQRQQGGQQNRGNQQRQDNRQGGQQQNRGNQQRQGQQQGGQRQQGGQQNRGNQQRQDNRQGGQQQNQQAPQQQKPRQRPQGGMTVDTRAGSTQVEMEKYNEKYDNLAQSKLGNRDTAAQKQKLTQRSAQRRAGKPVMSRKEKEDAKMRRLELERQRRKNLSITIPEEITVGELAARLHVTSAEIIKRLMGLGVMATVNETLDFDTASMVSIEIGAKVEKEVVVTIEDRLFEVEEDDDDKMVERPPIVVVMGHVDHGKTSLLDAIRNANVTADIAVIVVAADDGIMPQTVEAINHAKAAGVSIIVAVNKMDKPHANPDKVMQELTEYELVPEEWGGDVPCIKVSAKTSEGIPDLLEMIQLVADTSELKANPDKMAKGTVIEAKLDKGRGPVATILVQSGTLHTGDVVIAGTAIGRVRVMMNDRGEKVAEATPSMPVEITGLGDVPEAGDVFNAVEDERLAKELVDQRKFENKQQQFSSYEKVTLDNLFSHISQGDMKELPIIVKADVQGSVEAVKQSLEKLSNDEVRVKVIHGAVGAVSESDVMLADASNAIIVGFNVRPDPMAKDNAERDGVELRLYRIIYDAINDVETAMKGMLAPKTREVELGRAEIRQVYKITNVGTVAGCYVLEGKITRNAEIRVVRDGIIIADDHLSSLKRFKDDVKEVAKGYECGMGLNKFNDLKEGDIFEAYEIEEYRE